MRRLGIAVVAAIVAASLVVLIARRGEHGQPRAVVATTTSTSQLVLQAPPTADEPSPECDARRAADEVGSDYSYWADNAITTDELTADLLDIQRRLFDAENRSSQRLTIDAVTRAEGRLRVLFQQSFGRPRNDELSPIIGEFNVAYSQLVAATTNC